MKNIKTMILTGFLMLVAVTGFAQTTTTRTNLTVALAAGSNNNVLTVASATGISASTSSAQTFLFIGDGSTVGEQMQVVSVSGTNITVRRAVRGNAAAHPLNAVVWYGTPGDFNSNTGNTSGVFVGTTPNGTCTRTANQYLPVINPNNGMVSDCILSPAQGSPTATASTTSTWVSVSAFPLAYAKPYKKLAVSATTYTLLPSDYILGYNTNVAGTITIPALTGWVGKEYMIQLEITGSTSLTVATSSGQTINGATSIVLGGATSFGGAYIYTDGVNWFARRAH